MSNNGYFVHFEVPNINSTGVDAEVYAIYTNKNSLSAKNIGSSSVYNSNYQGVNGTFFGSSGLLGIAVQNGSPIGNNSSGSKNGSSTVNRTRGTLYCTTSGTIGVKRVVYAHDLTGNIADLKWAFGGLSLWLDESLSKSTYDSRLQNWEGSNGVGGINDKRPRTMLGYNSSNGDVVLAVAFDKNNTSSGITFYDARYIMSGLGCDKGIHLDGGSSSSIRFIEDHQDMADEVRRYRASTAGQQSMAVASNTNFRYSPSPIGIGLG
ncbi:phosphodiester glycosidase family protein [Marinicrinis sediminis]|uniref:Phosphodiester glycosidase family protein n=1 Tax=Marinicrinis sediminis TaxID=1652465 RepID=A0ABW5R6P6_9BACL